MGCPDRYEGQTVSVTGTIVNSMNLLGLAQMTTVKDGTGNTCLLGSRTELGKVGDMVTIENLIATHNPKKVLPNYLYPAGDPDLGK